MSEIAPLLQMLFRLQGYEAEESGNHVLLFRRGTERLALRFRETRDTLPAHIATELAETLPMLGHGVFVTTGEAGHEARAILERAGIDVWTREKLIHEVGKAFLAAAEHATLRDVLVVPGTSGPFAPVAEAGTSPAVEVPVTPPPAVAAAPAPASLWALRAPTPAPPAAPSPLAAFATPAPAPPALIPAAASPVPLLPPAPPTWSPPAATALTPMLVQAAPPPPPIPMTSQQTGGTIALGVGREEALRIGTGRLLKVEKVSLELVPLYPFRYACRLEAKGAPAQAKAGLLAVDAVTGTVRELQEPTFGLVTERGAKLEAMLSDTEAPDLVKRKVVELHTQKVRVKNGLGRNAAIVADQWVRPDPRSIQLDGQGTWLLPMWCMEGQNGSVRINGATGVIEEEKLKRAFAQDAEFL